MNFVIKSSVKKETIVKKIIMVCLVKLPNGTTFGIACDPKAIGQTCLEMVSLHNQNKVPKYLT